jgi:hypothetical protein
MKKKARIIGACPAIQVLISPSIFSGKVGDTCAPSMQTSLKLSIEVSSNDSKMIAGPNQTILDSNNLSYVMPTIVIGVGTRRSVKRRNWLKASLTPRGSALFRNYSTSCRSWSGDEITILLEKLRSQSIKKRNTKQVNDIVAQLICSPIFWLSCYESIKSNPGSQVLGVTVDGKVPKTLDDIELNFFEILATNIRTGRFQHGPIKKNNIFKSDGSLRKLGIANSRDKIVQKGMATILEIVSEPSFYENSMGFRRARSCHMAIKFIKQKVPSGV